MAADEELAGIPPSPWLTPACATQRWGATHTRPREEPMVEKGLGVENEGPKAPGLITITDFTR